MEWEFYQEEKADPRILGAFLCRSSIGMSFFGMGTEQGCDFLWDFGISPEIFPSFFGSVEGYFFPPPCFLCFLFWEAQQYSRFSMAMDSLRSSKHHFGFRKVWIPKFPHSGFRNSHIPAGKVGTFQISQTEQILWIWEYPSHSRGFFPRSNTTLSALVLFPPS